MTNAVMSVIVTASAVCGMCLGGVINAYDKAVYDEAISDPNFYVLVDREGNPVRQEPK